MNIILEHINNIIKEKENPQKVEELCNSLINVINCNFINSLTASETEAFRVLKQKIGKNKEIITSSSAIAEESKVTRTVVSNLFSKLKNAEIAIITSVGPRGSHIKIINDSVFKL